MKRFATLFAFAALIVQGLNAQKTIYIPDSWAYDAATGEYTEDGDSNLQWSMSRSRESENCIIFWQKGFGNDPSKAPSINGTSMTFDADDVLRVAEECYELNVNTLGFSSGNMLTKYKILILMKYTTTWTCYGSGYDFECSALWLNPATVKPAGHSLAHEVGHSFQYMCYAEAARYNHTSSTTIGTGFHLPIGNGQAIWEQTAQWQANQSYPSYMFSQSYPLFGNNANYAFSHEWMRYQSYWFLYYLCQHYDDITTVAQVWKQPMTGAVDFCQALIKLKKLTAEAFYSLYFDYALHCATFDFDAAAPYRNDYIGRFDYRAVPLDENKYQVAYASAPQSTGFNVVELAVPQAGTTVTTRFTALKPASALDENDPGEYNNGNPGTWLSAGVRKYNSVSRVAARGFRVGYVFLKNDGTREYHNDDIVHCKGTGEATEDISAEVPAGTKRLFLVIAPALATYIQHQWDDDIRNDDQWPYQFELVGTSATSVIPYVKEPDFEKAIDGRPISDVTLTYEVVLPPTSGHDGASVSFSGSALNALCTAFQMEGDELFGQILPYSSSQPNGTIMNYAARPNGSLQRVAKTTNGDFGHWFNASGTAISYGSGCVVFAEFTKASKSAVVGQYPNANKDGAKRTVREALHYKDANGKTATAYLVFNVTFQSGATPRSYLADIDYTDPTPDGIVPIDNGQSRIDNEEADIYDLSGRKLSIPHGLCIVKQGSAKANGKKVLEK